jgi:hypothetical protein
MLVGSVFKRGELISFRDFSTLFPLNGALRKRVSFALLGSGTQTKQTLTSEKSRKSFADIAQINSVNKTIC